MFYKATSVIYPFQDYFECSSLLINTNRKTLFNGFGKLEDFITVFGVTGKSTREKLPPEVY